MATQINLTTGTSSTTVNLALGGRGPAGADGSASVDQASITAAITNKATFAADNDLQTEIEVKSANFTAAIDGMYHAVATLTVTDPATPVEGKGFTVLIRNGTATIGGTAYANAGSIVRRVWHSGSYANYLYRDATAYATAAQGTDERVPTSAGLTSKFSTAKATIADNDRFAILDSAASNVPKHALWSTIKTTLLAWASSAATPNTVVKRGSEGESYFASTTVNAVSGVSTDGSGVYGQSGNFSGGGFLSDFGTGSESASVAGNYHSKFGLDTDGSNRSAVARVNGAYVWFRGAFRGFLQAAATLTADRTWTLGDWTGDIAGVDATQTLTNKTLTNPTVNNYTEGVVAIGNSGSSQTIALTSGTFQTMTMTANCTVTMPTATAGKSFVLRVSTGSGSFVPTFTGVKWPDNTAPTFSSTASRYYFVTFQADGTAWSGQVSGVYTP